MKRNMLPFMLFGLALAACQQTDRNPILTIEGGQLQGVVSTTSPDVTVYKGIPYAAPPVGNLRWRAPQPVLPWQGVKVASEFGAVSLQAPHVAGGPGGDKPGSVDYVKEFFSEGDAPMSEDCLYLNVWTPAAGKTDAQLPVALWIHGGAFMAGWGTEKEFDGEEYAKRGVILVTINYRLGAFGYLCHPLLTAENPEHTSGNYGLLDQIAALKWIQKNIAQFGGDPAKVTLFGQSAGAMSVTQMLASPLTENKIARAIIQSGGGLQPVDAPARQTFEQTQQTVKAVLDAAGVKTLEQMRSLSYDSLQAALRTGMTATKQYVRMAPIVDGVVVPTDFSTAVCKGIIPKIPYMIGSTKHDFGGVGNAEAIHAFSLELEKLGRSGAYVYLFNRELPGDQAGAFHSAELWYVFGTLARSWRPFVEVDFNLSKLMIDYWSNFMKNGTPNGDGLLEWKPFTAATPFVMEFDVCKSLRTSNIAQTY